MKYLPLIIFAIILCSSPGCSNQPTSSSTIARDSLRIKPEFNYSKERLPAVDSFINFVNATMEETHIPGAAIAIVKNNEIQLLKGYGVKSFGTTDSVNIHTVFRIASVSKGFASMLAGILVHENLFQWDDKVRKYLPHFSLKDTFNTNHLTIRHILSHTSGLPLHTFTNLIEDKVPYATLRDKLSTVDNVARVGTEFAYQNVIYSLISDIAQKVTGKSYEELLSIKIFKPLAMNDASASYAGLNASKNLALPHFRRDAASFRLTKNTSEYYSVLPAAGVNASISDMAKWLLALLGNSPAVIDSSILKEIYTPVIETPRRRKYQFFHWPHLNDAHYALGWRVLNYGGHTVVYHGGHLNGYRSEVAFCPAEKVGIVILTNASGKIANDGVEEFFDDYFGLKKNRNVPPAETKNAGDDPHSLDAP